MTEKGGRFGKYGENKRKQSLKDRKRKPERSKDLVKLEEHFKISPKHPGRGRK
jgi:hypothetical protein